jgi:hypothetical protein
MTKTVKDPPALANAIAYLAKHPKRYLFPTIEGKGRPAFKDNLNLASNDPVQLRAWQLEHGQRGTLLWACAAKKSGLVCVDVDMGLGKQGRESFRELKAAGSIFPKTERIATPSGGVHLIYEGEHHFSASKIGLHIDTPNYFMIAGTVRDDGREYKLERDVAAQKLPQWVADKIKPRADRERSNSPGERVPLELFKRMLAATPHTGGPAGLNNRHDYEGWLTFAMECHEASGGDEAEYLWAFTEWCLADPEWKDTWSAENIERHWLSFTADPSEDMAARTRASWFKLLLALGQGDLVGEAGPSAEADFQSDPLQRETDAEMAERLKRTAERRARREQQAEPETWESLKAGWCFIGQQKRYVRKRDGMLWETGAFSDYFASVEVQDKSTSATIHRWITTRKHGEFQKFDTFCYMPGEGENVGGAYNQYVPSKIVSLEGDTTLWDEHLKYLFPVEAIRKVVLDWLAWVLQNLDKKPKHALFIRGEVQGTGKSFIGDVFAELIGEHNRTPVDQGDFETPHNGWQMRTKLVTCEEVRSLSLPATRKLHGWITQPKLHINEKNMPQVTIPDVLAYLFFSNKADALPIDDTDRRYAIVGTNVKPKDRAYYCRLYDLLDDPVALGAIKHQLLNRPLDGYTAAGAAPYTDAKGEMIEASASDLQSYMFEHAGEVPFSYRLVTVDEIIERLPRHVLPRQRVHATLYDVLRRRFNGIHVEGQIRPRGSKGDKIRVWAIGPTPEAVTETLNSGSLATIYRDERAARSDDKGSDFADE